MSSIRGYTKRVQNEAFTEFIWQKGRELYRPMPWREDTRPYYVLVSELMLQQTQVSRVIPKFNAFVERFPDEASLCTATLSDVLKLWQGLGYNRRARYLHEAARRISTEHHGAFPKAASDILKLPGVGSNTSGAIQAYAFNRPMVFIETNVRTVYIHHYFQDDFDVDDKRIRDIVEATLDQENPREFYWALMDYGSWLKANGIRNNAQSKQYKKQAPLEGSLRQMRGRIVAALTTTDRLRNDELALLTAEDPRLEPALESLLKDGLISYSSDEYHLTN
jgi:A/G-specific adenine glycosylase